MRARRSVSARVRQAPAWPSSEQRADPVEQPEPWSHCLMVSLIEITQGRIREAADVPAVAILDDGSGRYLAPDSYERLAIDRACSADLTGLAISEGRHAYLDSIGVLPDHRRRGIATRLLAAGHAWADGAGLPCALDTVTDENVEFCQRRGYRIATAAAASRDHPSLGHGPSATTAGDRAGAHAGG